LHAGFFYEVNFARHEWEKRLRQRDFAFPSHVERNKLNKQKGLQRFTQFDIFTSYIIVNQQVIKDVG
jgi:hypothetical protein